MLITVTRTYNLKVTNRRTQEVIKPTFAKTFDITYDDEKVDGSEEYLQTVAKSLFRQEIAGLYFKDPEYAWTKDVPWVLTFE